MTDPLEDYRNPMRFSIRDRTIDLTEQPFQPTSIDVRPDGGNIYVHWESCGPGGKSIDQVYEDRNLLACALAAATGAPSGWKPDPEDDDDTWAIVWIETPMGQVSWHVPRRMVKQLGLYRRNSEYGGYGRDIKNDRLAGWAKRGCPY